MRREEKRGKEADVDLGHRVGRLRKAIGISQTDMAKRLDTTLSMQGKLERAERVYTLDTLRATAVILGTTPGALLDGGARTGQTAEGEKPTRRETAGLSLDGLDEDAIAILTLLRNRLRR